MVLRPIRWRNRELKEMPVIPFGMMVAWRVRRCRWIVLRALLIFGYLREMGA
jgi:hypothetical protein